jgi:hypothetical protein
LVPAALLFRHTPACVAAAPRHTPAQSTHDDHAPPVVSRSGQSHDRPPFLLTGIPYRQKVDRDVHSPVVCARLCAGMAGIQRVRGGRARDTRLSSPRFDRNLPPVSYTEICSIMPPLCTLGPSPWAADLTGASHKVHTHTDYCYLICAVSRYLPPAQISPLTSEVQHEPAMQNSEGLSPMGAMMEQWAAMEWGRQAVGVVDTAAPAPTSASGPGLTVLSSAMPASCAPGSANGSPTGRSSADPPRLVISPLRLWESGVRTRQLTLAG